MSQYRSRSRLLDLIMWAAIRVRTSLNTALAVDYLINAKRTPCLLWVHCLNTALAVDYLIINGKPTENSRIGLNTALAVDYLIGIITLKCIRALLMSQYRSRSRLLDHIRQDDSASSTQCLNTALAVDYLIKILKELLKEYNLISVSIPLSQ